MKSSVDSVTYSCKMEEGNVYGHLECEQQGKWQNDQVGMRVVDNQKMFSRGISLVGSGRQILICSLL